jgi:hypothetical protein
MSRHVRGPIQSTSEPVTGTTVSTFAERLLEIANDARRLRSHALTNSNSSVMLRAMAAEQAALTTLMTHMAVDEASVIDALAEAEAFVEVVVQLVFERPELGSSVAEAFNRAGSPENASVIAQMAAGRLAKLRSAAAAPAELAGATS